MLKNRIISVFFLACFALFAGHDLFPHKHIVEEDHVRHAAHVHRHHHRNHDHHHDHSKDSESPEDDLTNIFSYVLHFGDTDVLLQHASCFEFPKIKSVFITIIPDLGLHDFKPYVRPKIPDWDIGASHEYIFSCSSLRAPPVFLS